MVGCIRYIRSTSRTSSSLYLSTLIPPKFDGIGYKSGEHAMEKDEVWSDGSRIFISRGDEFDSLVSLWLVPDWTIPRSRKRQAAPLIAKALQSLVSDNNNFRKLSA